MSGRLLEDRLRPRMDAECGRRDLLVVAMVQAHLISQAKFSEIKDVGVPLVKRVADA